MLAMRQKRRARSREVAEISHDEVRSGLPDVANPNVIRRAEDLITQHPINIRLRYEEDVADAYREWFRNSISKDHRTELGRFLFGVSFTSMALLLTAIKLSSDLSKSLSKSISSNELVVMAISLGLLFCSALCGLYLAVPEARIVSLNGIELVPLQKRVGRQIRRWTLAWLLLWIVGLVIGTVSMVL